MVTGGCGGDDADTASPTTTKPAGPSLKITSPANGEHIKGNVVSLALESTGITIVKADGDASGKSGHFHVFIDADPVPAGQQFKRHPASFIRPTTLSSSRASARAPTT